MWVNVPVVQSRHDIGREEFVYVSEAVDGGLEFSDDVGDCSVVFGIILYNDTK
jgi:hypothetical protein